MASIPHGPLLQLLQNANSMVDWVVWLEVVAAALVVNGVVSVPMVDGDFVDDASKVDAADAAVVSSNVVVAVKIVTLPGVLVSCMLVVPALFVVVSTLLKDDNVCVDFASPLVDVVSIPVLDDAGPVVDSLAVVVVSSSELVMSCTVVGLPVLVVVV